MFKILFVLVINSYQGGVSTDLQFQNMAQCEAVKEQVLALEYRLSHTLRAACIEMQIPIKKTKCKVVNNFSYQNPIRIGNSSAHNLDGYPYPVELECVEE